MSEFLSVIVPTFNPRRDYLEATLAGLRKQTLAKDRWELIVVDNHSTPPLAGRVDLSWHPAARIVREDKQGLTHARIAGFNSTQGEFVVLVDDDNVLESGYLAHVDECLSSNRELGALGGKTIAEFESAPPPWMAEFHSLIACRDFGDEPATSPPAIERAGTGADLEYPAFAPIGAGMAVRRTALTAWLDGAATNSLTDRTGEELTSGGDCDIVLSVIRAGWQVAYFPQLSLKHLIPAFRIDPGYLARLNRGIAKSWIQVLTKHGICPWGPIPGWSVPLRKLKAWVNYRAWAGQVQYIRWSGACGHFEGRALGSRPSAGT